MWRYQTFVDSVSSSRSDQLPEGTVVRDLDLVAGDVRAAVVRRRGPGEVDYGRAQRGRGESRGRLAGTELREL